MAAQETEIERLVVRLVGDGSAYTGMLDEVIDATKEAEKQFNLSGGAIESLRTQLETAARSGDLSTISLEKLAAAATEVATQIDQARDDEEKYVNIVNEAIKATEKYEAEQKKIADEQARAADQAERDLQRQIDSTLKLIEAEERQLQLRAKEITQSVTRRSVQKEYEKGLSEIDDLLKKTYIDQETFNKAAANLRGNQIKAYGEELTKIGKNLSLYVSAPLIGFGALSVARFGEAEQASMKLEAAIDANGRSVRESMKDYQAFAAQMQKVTVVDDDAVLSLIQQAETLGVTGEAAKRAAQNAIALQSARGIGIHAAIRMTTALEEGNANLLQRQLPGLKAIKGETEKAAYAQEQLAKMFGVAKAEAQTMTGQIKQARNEFENAQEVIGGVISQSLLPVIKIIKDAALAFQDLSPSTQSAIVYIAGAAAAIGPLIVMAGQLVTAIGGIVSAVGALGGLPAILTAAINPVTLLAGAFAYLAIELNKVGDEILKELDREIDLNNKQSEINKARVMEVRRNVDKERAEKGLAPKFTDVEKGLKAPEVKKPAVPNSSDLKKLQEFEDHIKAQVEALGHSGAAAKIAEFAMKGFSDEQLKAARDLEKQLEVGQKTERLKEFTKELNAQTAAIGKSAGEAKIYQAELDGVGKAEIDAAKQAILANDIAKQLNENKENLKKSSQSLRDHLIEESAALDRNIAGLISQGDAYRESTSAAEIAKLQQEGLNGVELEQMKQRAQEIDQMKRREEFIRKGISMQESLLKPQEKLQKKQEELKNIFEAGGFGEGAKGAEMYKRALTELDQQVHKDYTAHFNVTGVQAVEAGTAEAAAMFREFQLGKMHIKPQDVAAAAARTPNLDKNDPTRKLVENALGKEQPKDPLLEEINEGIKKLVEIAISESTKEEITLSPADFAASF